MDISLIISQQEPEIRITRTHIYEDAESRQELKYFSDERGETNPTILVGEVVKSKTKWSGDKLVSKSSGQAEIGPRATVFYERVDEWRLSKDGNTLINTTRISNARSRDGQPLLTVDRQNVPPPFDKSVTARVFRRSAQD